MNKIFLPLTLSIVSLGFTTNASASPSELFAACLEEAHCEIVGTPNPSDLFIAFPASLETSLRNACEMIQADGVQGGFAIDTTFDASGSGDLYFTAQCVQVFDGDYSDNPGNEFGF